MNICQVNKKKAHLYQTPSDCRQSLGLVQALFLIVRDRYLFKSANKDMFFANKDMFFMAVIG